MQKKIYKSKLKELISHLFLRHQVYNVLIINILRKGFNF